MSTATNPIIAAGNPLKSEKFFRSLFDNMLEGMAFCQLICSNDVPQDILYLDVNKAFEKLSGLKDVVGKKISEIIPGFNSSNPELLQVYGRVALSGNSEKFETNSDAYGGWLSISVYSPEKYYFVAMFENITERKQSEEAIMRSQLMLQNIIDLLPIRIFWKDSELKYLGCNLCFAQDAGKTAPAELIGKDDYVMAWKDQAEQYRQDDLAVIASGVSKLNYEEPQTKPDGSTMWLNTNKVLLRDKQGKVAGVLGTYLDITERKLGDENLKRALAEAQKMLEITTGRELKMVELKQQIKDLESKIPNS